MVSLCTLPSRARSISGPRPWAARAAELARWLVRGPLRVEVTGESMRPCLVPGDRLVVLPAGRVRAGDVVVLTHPGQAKLRMVKRVVAVGADGCVTVAGDNPAASTDSRHFGPVGAALVLGRVVYRYAPERRRGPVPPPVEPGGASPTPPGRR